MTDGTSQGLFIVVAIVIFGIFIALSHTVFGSTLSDGLDNIFNTSLNTALSVFEDGEIIYSKSAVELSSMGNESGDYSMGSFAIHEDYFEQDGQYTLRYTVDILEGEYASFRGHLHTSSNQEMYINDTLLVREDVHSWRTYIDGYLFDTPFDVGEQVHFEMKFTTDRYDDPISTPRRHLSISPNNYMNDGRQRHEVESRVIIRNIQLIKHN